MGLVKDIYSKSQKYQSGREIEGSSVNKSSFRTHPNHNNTCHGFQPVGHGLLKTLPKPQSFPIPLIKIKD
uniref:Uncharacterized protein n=1 Tax=Arundo donax TaxID=35708 RepID=A0A0A9FPF4_ARUDO